MKMVGRLLGAALLIGIVVLLGCGTLGEGDYIGVIVNRSSYTLNVVDPLDESKYFRLRPGEQTKRYALSEGRYTFRAYYASDNTLYEALPIRINGIENDAALDGLMYDWAVIFVDPVWWLDRVEYYP